MGLGEAAQGGMVVLALMVVAGYFLLAVVVSLVVGRLTRSWRTGGLTFAAFVAVGVVLWWLGSADQRARDRALDRAYEITDPVWRSVGIDPVRAFNGVEQEGCMAAGVDTVFTTARITEPADAIQAIARELRTDGWETLELREPDGDRQWIYAARHGETVVVWSGEARPGLGESVNIEVRLNDCYELSAPPGSVEDPNCARGGSINCTEPGRLVPRDR